MTDLTFRTAGPWGAGKGSNLLASEVDANFWALAQEIVDLQGNAAAAANGIASIAVSGTQMSIVLTDGTILGPYTLPALTFRWRGEWETSASYAELDVVKVTNVGIYMVQIDHVSDAAEFDAARTDGDTLVYFQLFGSADASLSALPDVALTDLADGDILHWVAANDNWENVAPGSMAFQDADAVEITGGSITGLPNPVDASDAATKAYVDASPTGTTADDATILSNISGGVTSSSPNTLSDVLDYILGSSVRGTLMYRGGEGWQALPPGTSGDFLKTLGDGSDPIWDTGGSGVTDIAAGPGISTGGSDITGTGTVSLAEIDDTKFLANVAGETAAPTPQTISAFLDYVVSNARGTILTRTNTGWVGLATGTSGQYLKSQGSGADLVWDAPAGSGTVTSVAAGTGLAGGTITGAGTVSLATIADKRLFANISGGAAAPSANTLTGIIDNIIGTTQGAVLYRNGSAWVKLDPGTNGQVLTTGGAAANPAWADAPVSGGTIVNQRLVANISGSTGVPSGQKLTDIFDSILGSSRGMIIWRAASGWSVLAPGTSGQVLVTGGSGGNPSWVTNAGASLSITSPAAQDTLYYNSSSGKFENVRPKYIVGVFAPGAMTASQSLLYHKFSKAVTLPANLGAYLGHTTEAGAGVAATASTAIILQKATAASPTSFSTVATVTFGVGGTTGSMSTQAAITFAQGDVLRIRGPSSADATLADVAFTLVGFET